MRLRDDLMLRHLGDDHVIVDPGQEMVDMSKVYTLNETAAFLWNELHGKDFSEADIVKLLMENYDVDIELAEKDTKQLLTDFKKQGLLAGN
ncbi:PqqD family protein [Albibacterium indicum]|uniref:PqqD family protein n=1 Tax=Albibacterium indicum TaxID=2292082 RepID=UPI000E468C49|nr:PqqD family protein [Pedobacter indicus]